MAIARTHRYYTNPNQLDLLGKGTDPYAASVITSETSLADGDGLKIDASRETKHLETVIDEGELDKLLDHGFSYAQAVRMLGEAVVAQPEDIKPQQRSKNAYKKSKTVPHTDRRRLSFAGKRIADEPPAHERKPY